MKPDTRLVRNSALLLAVAVLGGSLVSCNHAQSPDFDTSFSIAEIMDAIVMPEADVVWNAVAYVSTEEGFTSTGPETDEDWADLRRHAVALAESANTLAIPGRAANRPDAEAVEGELSPAEIDALIASNRGAWLAFTTTLRAASMKTLEAIDARDADRILDVGGDIDLACENCHLTFWYPDQ